MKKIIIKTILTIISACAMIVPLYAENNLQVHKTKFISSFRSLTIPSIWKIEDNNINGIVFDHAENPNVSFGLIAGKPLKKQASLDELEEQFINFMNKTSKTIPLLKKSFGWFIEKEETNAMRKCLYPSFKRVTFGKIQWLKIVCAGEIEISTIVGEYSETIEITTQNIVYAAFINNCLHLAECCAPEDYYEDYSDLFDTTMEQISS